MKAFYRVLISVISITMFLNFIVMAGIGVFKTMHAIYILVMEGFEGKPGVEVLESLDLFLVSFVFLILSLSFNKLFNPESTLFTGISLPWLKIDDFFKLKHITWSAILLTMVVIFGTQVIKGTQQLDYPLLIVPVSVLLLSISAKFLKE